MLQLTLRQLENLGVQAIANSPSEIIQQMNQLGKHTIVQNKYISGLVTWLHNHMDDNQNNNMVLESLLGDWFNDRDIQNVHQVLKRIQKHDNQQTKWIAQPTEQIMKKLLAQGYQWVSGPYTAKSIHPRPVNFEDITELLWVLNDKQEAYDEVNN